MFGCEAEGGEAAVGVLEMPPVGLGDVGPAADFQVEMARSRRATMTAGPLPVRIGPKIEAQAPLLLSSAHLAPPTGTGRSPSGRYRRDLFTSH
jgi:hypothetical protein